MPRFSLKDLLTAITMAALGFGLIAVAWRLISNRYIDQFGISAAVMYLCGCSLTGAGVMHPFGKTAKGAWFGAMAAVPALIVVGIAQRFEIFWPKL
jgi:hypothetical protein